MPDSVSYNGNARFRATLAEVYAMTARASRLYWKGDSGRGFEFAGYTSRG